MRSAEFSGPVNYDGSIRSPASRRHGLATGSGNKVARAEMSGPVDSDGDVHF